MKYAAIPNSRAVSWEIIIYDTVKNSISGFIAFVKDLSVRSLDIMHFEVWKSKDLYSPDPILLIYLNAIIHI